MIELIRNFMVWYLRKKGFVVFHLDECARFCIQGKDGRYTNYCWMELYNQEMVREKEKKNATRVYE